MIVWIVLRGNNQRAISICFKNVCLCVSIYTCFLGIPSMSNTKVILYRSGLKKLLAPLDLKKLRTTKIQLNSIQQGVLNICCFD